MSQVIRDAALFWAKLDPEAPVNPFNEAYPHWEVQIRTTSKSVADEWKAKDLTVKKQDDDNGSFYRVNLKAKAFNRDGKARKPVVVVDGEMMPLDGKIIGNGSIGNVQVDQYEYTMNGKTDIGTAIRAIQVTELVEYKAGGLAFENEGATKVVAPTSLEGMDDDFS